MDTVTYCRPNLIPHKLNEWVLGHLCAHVGLTGPGEPPEDGEMN